MIMIRPQFSGWYKKMHRLVTVLALGVAAARAANPNFEPPPWAGQLAAEVSEWDNFTSAFGAGNAPDVAGSNGDAVLQQTTPGATLTGTLNIYNPAGASGFTITDAFAAPVADVVFHATVSGTAIDVDSVKLVFMEGGESVSLGTVREELLRVSGGFGDTITSRWSWRLRGRNTDEFTIRFAATGAHCSLTAARLDVRFKPDATAATWEEPAHDRWNYPFNATPGTRSVASTFVSDSDEGLVRFGTFVLGFDTSTAVEAGRGAVAYEVVAARVTLMTSANFEVVYDPSADPAHSYLTNGHPQLIEDADAGRPLELFGAGFRDGFTPLTWTETAPYAPEGGERSVYPVTWDANGAELDASMNVNFAAPYEALPFAAGVIAGTTPGENVPHDTPVAFDLDLTEPGVLRYLQNALDLGRLFFTATSLHGGGQGVRTFPEYYTRDSLLGEAPKLELTVRLHEREEVITLSSLDAAPAGRALRFPVLEGADYGVRWSTDLKSWQLVREPVLTFPEAGVAEWVDDSAAGATKFYQVYLKP